jgi:glycosyltransferase involved in cell wall biosynthesis
MASSVTITIHTHNEEKNIEACIESACLLSNHIQVVDMMSTDKTVSIAKKLGVEVFSFPYSQYVEPSRQFGITKAKTNWVFILDADERMTLFLAEEIKSAIQNPQYSYYKIARKNIFNITWLKHGGWWPDYQIRLINKKFFKKWPKEIHSTPLIEGTGGFLKQPLLHYFHGDLEQMVNKTVIFEDIESDLLYKAGKNASSVIFLRKFLGELYRRLFRYFGFLDGTIGIIESIYQAFSKTITYLFLYEKHKKKSPCLPAGRSL